MSWVSAHAEINVSVLECEEPEVQVVQAPRLAIWRSQPTLVEASVDLKGCLRYGAQYLWQILSAPSCDNDPHFASGWVNGATRSFPVIPLPAEVDVQRLQLSLPKMVLAAGNYTLVFSLSYENVPLKKAACLQLGVMAARSVEEHVLTISVFVYIHPYLLPADMHLMKSMDLFPSFVSNWSLEHTRLKLHRLAQESLLSLGTTVDR